MSKVSHNCINRKQKICMLLKMQRIFCYMTFISQVGKSIRGWNWK